jgi:hypothetical protein
LRPNSNEIQFSKSVAKAGVQTKTVWVLLHPQVWSFVLADGTGGHPDEVAAQVALQTISALYQKRHVR